VLAHLLFYNIPANNSAMAGGIIPGTSINAAEATMHIRPSGIPIMGINITIFFTSFVSTNVGASQNVYDDRFIDTQVINSSDTLSDAYTSFNESLCI
jgi:hypothetical protein